MRIFITGSSGLLGTYLVANLLSNDDDLIYAGYRRHQLPISDRRIVHRRIDITDKESLVQILDLEPDVIIHTAGITDVDYCEQYPHVAMAVNATGTMNIASVALLCGAKLIHISTNDVFCDAPNGKGWGIDDQPYPYNWYAKSKVDAEQSIQGLIVRTTFHGWCYRPEHSFSHKLINNLRGNKLVKMAVDQRSSLMYAGDAAKIIVELAKSDRTGIVHLASEVSSSRFVFANMVAQIFGLNEKLIQPVQYDQLHEELGLKAKRPMRAILEPNPHTNITLEDGIDHMKLDEEHMQRIMQVGRISW